MTEALATEFLDQVTPMIITFNEKENIARTLARLGWAREILVIDSGSTDGTLEILSADPRIRVVHRPFDSFAGQCNFGLTELHTPWVLSLDADYAVTEALVREMAQLNAGADISGYRAGFIYCVFGRPLRSTLYPPRTILYRVDRARYADEGHGHRLVVDGTVADLAGKVEHDDRKPLDRWFRSQIRYAQQEADHLLSADDAQLSRIDKLRRKGWPAPLLMLAYTLIWRGYALDGRAGLYYSFQRTLAELMLAVQLLDRRLRR